MIIVVKDKVLGASYLEELFAISNAEMAAIGNLNHDIINRKNSCRPHFKQPCILGYISLSFLFF